MVFTGAVRKHQPRRIRSAMNHHIIKGGHLSAQPMEALRDFVARHPRFEKPAAINFTVLAENPYMINLEAFRNAYQPAVLANAKAFARAQDEVGLDVAGDRSLSFTKTHRVILNVGYGQGTEIARRLERNYIILNYQAGPYAEGFTAADCLRMGVAEMTRFGHAVREFCRAGGTDARGNCQKPSGQSRGCRVA